MKFERDNSRVALTQEVKDKITEEERQIKEEQQLHLETHERVKAEFDDLQAKYKKVTDELAARQISYAPIDYQLDLLWHDMERGAVPVDKEAENTWYQHIKTVKETNSLSPRWRQEIQEIHEKLMSLNSNNSIKIV